MPHPHQSFLDELKIAIDKLVPLTPVEFVQEAKNIHKDLLENPEASEKQIHQALSHIGRKEYPYRKAYEELCEGDEEKRLQVAVFERIEPEVKKKITDVTNHGVMLDDYISSKLFEEQLTADERYQVEQAVLASEDILDHQCSERAEKRHQDYHELVKKYEFEVERLQKMIDGLRAMGTEDPKWTTEIDSIADKLEEGWSIVETDPEEENIKKEIEYWNTVLHEDEEI
ncbi:hypothetical protein KJ766_03715 [Patescibacteria group bacterium]|nr:hypothetical protein [Patescibacteria group bacterium]